MRSDPTRIVKMVEPYISIISPGSRTPTLIASAAASIVPTITGVPGASPVSSAACLVTVPAISVVQAISGRRSSSVMSGARASLHARLSMS